ncbi:MAG TPA: gluconokinase [Casimicrobiaceae bacterium]|nr:gluconokinase [Casimicrobiaceae bacterium]
MIVVVMGVTGCGKSTVGAALADRLAWPFLDADDFHPSVNVQKMAAGIPLADDDRWPWLDGLAVEMRAILARGGHAVLACSALKARYRERLARAGDVRFVHLLGDHDTIASRLATRSHRYMPPTLLKSQFATLEAPTDAVAIPIDMAVEEQIERIIGMLQLQPTASR